MREFVKKILKCSYKFKDRKMSADAPIGIQWIQRLGARLCPRLHINKLRWYRISILALTYITYMTYHLTRKPISVVKSVLHRNCSELIPPNPPPTDDQWCNWAPFNTSDANTLLGSLDSAFLFSYAGAMFVSGLVAERVDLRYFLTLGMLCSATFCYLFGLARTCDIHHISYYIFVQAGAGVAQTTGWPGAVAAVGNWFGDSKKGLIFGIWNSHTSLGNILGTLTAGAFVEQDWALSFMWPALVMAAAAMLVFLFLIPEPRHVGLLLENSPSHPPSRSSRRSLQEDEPTQVLVGDQTASLRPNRHSANTQSWREEEDATEQTALLANSNTSSRSAGSAVSLTRALAIPGVVEFSLSLFFSKLVSYTFLFWLPVYINNSTHLSPKQSGDLSTVFDVGGILGAILAGLLADWCATPALVCLTFYALCGPALLAYQWWGALSYSLNVQLLVLAGILVNGPYALITTAVAAELGTHSSLAGNARALATVAGIIDGTGSVGAALGPMLAGVLSGASWAHVFYLLILCNYLALLLLLRIAKWEIQKLRGETRVVTSRVRVE